MLTISSTILAASTPFGVLWLLDHPQSYIQFVNILSNSTWGYIELQWNALNDTLPFLPFLRPIVVFSANATSNLLAACTTTVYEEYHGHFDWQKLRSKFVMTSCLYQN